MRLIMSKNMDSIYGLNDHNKYSFISIVVMVGGKIWNDFSGFLYFCKVGQIEPLSGSVLARQAYVDTHYRCC